MMEEAEALTRENTSLRLCVAFNYGSRQELTRVAQTIAEPVPTRAEAGRWDRAADSLCWLGQAVADCVS